MDQLEQIKDLCLHMEDISSDAGYPPIDRVRLVSNHGEPDEVWFIWEELKLVIQVELTAGPERLAEALEHAVAGDPALN